MKRHTLPFAGSMLLPLALLGACADQELPTALEPEGAAFSEGRNVRGHGPGR